MQTICWHLLKDYISGHPNMNYLFWWISFPTKFKCVCVCVCVWMSECDLLFCCRWLVPGFWLVSGSWLLNLWFRRYETLDLLRADGYFIWLQPPLEMFQGAAKEQKKEWLDQTLLVSYLIMIFPQTLHPHPPPTVSYNYFSLLTWGPGAAVCSGSSMA